MTTKLLQHRCTAALQQCVGRVRRLIGKTWFMHKCARACVRTGDMRRQHVRCMYTSRSKRHIVQSASIVGDGVSIRQCHFDNALFHDSGDCGSVFCLSEKHSNAAFQINTLSMNDAHVVIGGRQGQVSGGRNQP